MQRVSVIQTHIERIIKELSKKSKKGAKAIWNRENHIAVMVGGILLVGFIVGITTHSLNAATIPAGTYNEDVELNKEAQTEILWLARILYSESKRRDEQVLIAWIVRNRVETGFRGGTYQEVALSSKQFSGLHSTDSHYNHNISRDWESEGEVWQEALEIAREVYTAPDGLRPFSLTVRHFYSPVAVSVPKWAHGKEPLLTIVDSNSGAVRFAFYEGVN